MIMPITTDALRHAIDSIGKKLEAEHQTLTDLDGKVGDGDLGFTLLKAFRAMGDISPSLPPDLGMALMQLGQATTKVSSSSFGTLMATGLLAVAKSVRGRESIEWSELSALLTTAREAMQARGKANLGDKTVLDALVAVEGAIRGMTDPAEERSAAKTAAEAAMTAFRNQPNKIGRARVYGDKTIGLDDPGMAAVTLMVEALGRQPQSSA